MIGCSSNAEWAVLFDGKIVNGLRGYKQSGFPDSWEVVDGGDDNLSKMVLLPLKEIFNDTNKSS